MVVMFSPWVAGIEGSGFFGNSDHIVRAERCNSLIKKVVKIDDCLLLIYDHEKLGEEEVPSEDDSDYIKPRRSQNVLLCEAVGSMKWKVGNDSDDYFVDFKYKDDRTQLISSRGALYDLDIETGVIVPAEEVPWEKSLFRGTLAKKEKETSYLDVQERRVVENIVILEKDFFVIEKRGILLEEIIAIKGKALIIYKHHDLSENTDPKKNQNVCLVDNKRDILWIVNNPAEDIFFLGAIYKNGRAQLIASSGDLYDLAIETGDITLASRTQE